MSVYSLFRKRLLTIGLMTLLVYMMVGCSSPTQHKEGQGDNIGSKGQQSSGLEEEAIFDFAVVLRDSEVSPSDILIYQELEEATGVKINWITSPESGWAEKRALLFASDELPDAFFGNAILTDEDVLKYGAQGLIIPLESYIRPEIMPNLYKVFEAYPEYKNTIIAPDGHIYGLPSYDDGMVTTTNLPLYINQNWLNAVDMDVPKTTEEFYKVLKAFKEHDVNGNGDSNDEVPFSFQKYSNYVSDLFGAFGVIDDRKHHIDISDGKAYYTAITPEYKEAIIYFNRLFSEGLIDQEAFTHDTKSFAAKLMSEERIVGSFQAWRSNKWAVDKGDNSYIPMSPLIGPEGDQLWPRRNNGVKSRGSFVISHKAKDPEEIMRWVDNIYEPLFALQTSFALKIGYHIGDTDGNGKYETLREATAENRSGIITQGFERIDNVTKETALLLEEKPAHIVEKHMLDQYYNDYYKDESYPKVFFTLEEVGRLARLKIDLISYTNEMYAKWMMVGGIEEEWDDYLLKLDKMGIEEYVSIYQEALERFNKQVEQ